MGGLEDKVKGSVQRGREAVERGTGVNTFGARVKHFWQEGWSDVALAGELIVGNVIYTAVNGYMPTPLEEAGLIAGTKILNDYIVGEAIKNRGKNLSGWQAFRNYIKRDFGWDFFETAVLTGIAYGLMQNPANYPIETDASYAANLAKDAGIVGAAAIGIDGFLSFIVPVGKWGWDNLNKVNDNRYKADTPSGTP